MAARMIVIYNGEEWKSKTTEEMTAEQMRDAVYEKLEELGKMTMDADGYFMVFGEEVLQRAIILFQDV